MNMYVAAMRMTPYAARISSMRGVNELVRFCNSWNPSTMAMPAVRSIAHNPVGFANPLLNSRTNSLHTATSPSRLILRHTE